MVSVSVKVYLFGCVSIIESFPCTSAGQTLSIMSYQLYRNTTLGITLQDSLDELISSQQITPDLALKVLKQFDSSMSTHLSRVRTRYNFKGKLRVYRFCDNVWTCVVEDVEFRDTQGQDNVSARRVKIVACDATNTGK